MTRDIVYFTPEFDLNKYARTLEQYDNEKDEHGNYKFSAIIAD